jgi:hypothetical protein
LVGATHEKSRVVKDGNVITAGGVTSGIDFGLNVVAEIAGATVAQATSTTLRHRLTQAILIARPTLPRSRWPLDMKRREQHFAKGSLDYRRCELAPARCRLRVIRVGTGPGRLPGYVRYGVVPMSAWVKSGHNALGSMFALPPKADIRRLGCDVR